MPTRLGRAEQSAKNRAALLRAARKVFLRAGYHGATVEAVANEAGFTIGAVYSRFGGKADLFFALLEERVAERAVQFADLAKVSAPSKHSQGPAPAIDAARRWTEIMRTDLDWSLLVIEFRVHAARDEVLNHRYAALHERAIDGLAANIATTVSELGEVDVQAVRSLARAAFAMSTGAALARAVGPDAFDDQLYEETSVALAAHFVAVFER